MKTNHSEHLLEGDTVIFTEPGHAPVMAEVTEVLPASMEVLGKAYMLQAGTRQVMAFSDEVERYSHTPEPELVE